MMAVIVCRAIPQYASGQGDAMVNHAVSESCGRTEAWQSAARL